MPKKTNSFQYELNNLPIKDYKYDYYNAIIARYQDVRTEYINQKGNLDEKNLVKERYTDYPVFISHNNMSAKEMLFANRGNGYFAYTDKIDRSKEDPLYAFTLETVDAFPEYLSRVHETSKQGFFYINETLSCYAQVTSTDVLVELYEGAYSLLFFCESYTYTPGVDATSGAVGKLVLSSPYFPDKKIDVYTKDSIGSLEQYTVYAKISDSDPHPTEKIPGEPIYKTIIITGVGSEVTKINIDGLELDTTSDLNKVIKATDDRFNENYVGVKYTGSGKIELGFSLPYKPDPLTETEFPIKLYVNGAWTEEKVCKVYFKNNHIQSLTTTIAVDNQDKYLDVPTSYTLRAENRYFLANPSTRKTTEMFYLDIEREVPIQYKGVVSSRYVYETDSITVSVEKGKVPGEYTFKLIDVYSKVNGFDIPVWMYGYTSGEIRPIPDDYIKITPTLKSTFSYTEYDTTEYTFEFAHTGTVTLSEVGLKTVNDDYGYFSSSDFTITKVSEEDGKMTYKLGLDKKIFIDPKNVTKVPVRIVFRYTVKRKDLSVLNWPAETFNATMTITYVKDRWEIIDVTIDNNLLGDAKITYRLKDKLLGVNTNKFSSDLRLAPTGKTVYSSNVKKLFDNSDWDNRQKLWTDNINITSFGDIQFQFQSAVANSNIYTISHDEPTHPLVVTPHPVAINISTISRIKIDLKYKEPITGIYVNGSYLTNGTPIKLNNVKDGSGLMFPLYTADKKEIIGIGLDLTPIEEEDIEVTMNFTDVNDYDFTSWPLKSVFTIPVKKEAFNFSFVLTDFAFDKNSTGILSLNDVLLADSKIVATVLNAANDVVVARPNFNPIGNGDFKTTNLFLDGYLSSQKQYLLDFEVFEYVNAAKDNDLPNQLYYHAIIPFTVE